MNQLVSDSVELLRSIIPIQSFSSHEEKVWTLISSKLSGWGIDHKLCSGNIIAYNKKYDPSKPTLALDAHMDTVKPSGSYTRDPFDPGNDPEIIYGLGANDDGGSLVTMLAAFRHFYEADMPINLALVLSREEETSGPLGAELVYGPNGPFAAGSPKWCIIGEPTQMRAATSERGLLVLDGEAHGVSGHAARNEGVNALYIALDDISALRGHKFERKSTLMGDVKLTVTQIEAGSAHNVVPDLCKFVVDIRPTNAYRNEEILQECQALCKSTLKARSLLHASSATFDGSPLLKCLERCGVETFSSPTTSNWMITHRDSIKMGPGDSARSHKADEYILVSEIEDAFGKYIKFIENFYGNTLE